MSRKRIFVAAGAVALTLGLGAGIAAAQNDPTPPDRPTGTMHDGDMDAMHAQMPGEMQAYCDTMHDHGGMTGGAMMNGAMTGSGMTGAGMMVQR